MSILVGAFWNTRQVREANKERRRVDRFQRKHRNVVKSLLELARAEDDLEQVGLDPEEVYDALALAHFDTVEDSPYPVSTINTSADLSSPGVLGVGGLLLGWQGYSTTYGW